MLLRPNWVANSTKVVLLVIIVELLWNLHTRTWPSITDRLYSAWDVVVTTAVRERDGLQDLPVIDLAASHIHDMNADARHTKKIAMHQTLSVIYQSQKTKWRNSQVHCAGAQEPNTFVPETRG